MRLNRSRHYGEVFGMPGVTWQQDANYFRRDGIHVTEHGAVIENGHAEPEPVAKPHVAKAAKPKGRAAVKAKVKPMGTQAMTEAPKERSNEETEFLRQQMLLFNHPWTTPEAARRFIAGRDE